jgi:TRAP-type C4-dicarboxylate transport system substrate-binding protein
LKIKSVFLSIVLLLSLFLAACGSSESSGSAKEKVYNAKLTHSGSDGVHVDNLVDEFAAMVKEKSNGRLNITVYPAGQLFKDTKNPEAITNGATEMALNSSTLWGDTIPSMEILGIPAVFTEPEQVHEALDGEIGDIIREDMRAKGVEPVMFLDYSHMYFSSNEPLTSKDSFKNKNVRTANTTHSQWVEAMGAVPISMAGTEVIEAISRGMLDGNISGVDSFASRKIYDFVDTYSGPLYFEVFSVTANKAWLESLPNDLRKIFKEASLEIQEKSYATLNEIEEKAHKEVQENGMKLVEPTEEDKQEWLKASEKILDDYSKEAGESGKRILEVMGLTKGLSQ